MRFTYNIWSVGRLIELISKSKINLKPSYQRNFIWGKKDQSLLIESIRKGYPIPSFFIFQGSNGEFEMVDGQQRSRTIFQYFTGELELKDNSYKFLKDQSLFLEYPLNVTIISDLTPSDSLEQFYTLVNKSGYRLNPNELNKAQYHDSVFLDLVERIVDSQELKELDIFTDANKKRMNDRALIEEIVASVFSGIFDKRVAVNAIYKGDITKEESDSLFLTTTKILHKILALNKICPLNQTRYSQRNDFLTLFQFIFQNEDESYPILEYQYKILLLVERHIRPTQEDCPPFKDYALNCVSQTNSKQAREGRLLFFDMLLKNSHIEGSKELNSILEYLEDFHGIEEPTKLVQINSFFLLDIEKFSK